MISRRKIFGWFSGLIGGAVAMPAILKGEPATTIWRPTDAQLVRYHALCQYRDLLRPGAYDWVSEDHAVLGRSVDIDRPGLYADSLIVRSYNGYDRRELWFELKLADLETRRREVWAEAKAAILPPKERTYLEQVRDEVMDLGKPVIAANPHLEFTAWVDNTTANILCKAYHSTEHYACAYALTNYGIRKGAYVKDAKAGWANMADVMNNKPIPADWYVEKQSRKIMKIEAA